MRLISNPGTVQVQAQGTVHLRGAAYTIASPGVVQVQAQGTVRLRGSAYTRPVEVWYSIGTSSVQRKGAACPKSRFDRSTGPARGTALRSSTPQVQV